jgi:hypothetical protein
MYTEAPNTIGFNASLFLGGKSVNSSDHRRLVLGGPKLMLVAMRTYFFCTTVAGPGMPVQFKHSCALCSARSPTFRSCFPQRHQHDFTGLSFCLHFQHSVSPLTRITFPHLHLTRSVDD